jgi:hypothetical protein
MPLFDPFRPQPEPLDRAFVCHPVHPQGFAGVFVHESCRASEVATYLRGGLRSPTHTTPPQTTILAAALLAALPAVIRAVSIDPAVILRAE